MDPLSLEFRGDGFGGGGAVLTLAFARTTTPATSSSSPSRESLTQESTRIPHVRVGPRIVYPHLLQTYQYQNLGTIPSRLLTMDITDRSFSNLKTLMGLFRFCFMKRKGRSGSHMADIVGRTFRILRVHGGIGIEDGRG